VPLAVGQIKVYANSFSPYRERGVGLIYQYGELLIWKYRIFVFSYSNFILSLF